MSGSKRAWGKTARRWLKRLGVALGLVVLVPLLLVPLYGFVAPISIPMLERYLTGRPVIRDWQGIDQVSDRLKAAVVMSEDGQFCRHWGIDLGALRAELRDLMNGESPRGASTITMQVARNLFLWNDRSYLRKALEIPLALYIDLVLPKRRIMEIYLNIAEWGPNGQFGIAAGTQTAFGTGPESLSWGRAALMAVALPNPVLRLPARPTRHVQRVAEIVEARARQGANRIGCLYPSGRVSLQ